VIVRFCDDFVVGFEHRDDAERFWADLRDRLAQFHLELNAEKTGSSRHRVVNLAGNRA